MSNVGHILYLYHQGMIPSIIREWFSPSPENDSLMTEIKYSEWLRFCSEITQLVNCDDIINIRITRHTDSNHQICCILTQGVMGRGVLCAYTAVLLPEENHEASTLICPTAGLDKCVLLGENPACCTKILSTGDRE
jgi:hypothetical protein